MGTSNMNAATARVAKLDEIETPNEFEGEIREFIRRDASNLRRPLPDGRDRKSVV